MIATITGSSQIFAAAEDCQVISEGYWEWEGVGQRAGDDGGRQPR